MSDLQISLLIIGVLVVVGVLAYNRWQETKLRRRGEADFGSRHEDVLMRAGVAADRPETGGGARTQSGELHAPVAEALAARHAVEHTMEAADVGSPAPVSGAAAHAGPEHPGPRVLDDAVDCIVSLNCPSAVADTAILEQEEAVAFQGLARPIHWEAFDAALGGWEQPAAQKRYARIRAGMQLANRRGPATAEDIGAFFEGMQEAALALGAEIDLPDPEEALRRAQELDRLCSEVDVQVGLNVVATAGATFPGTKIRALAESAGMQFGKNGGLHRLSEGGAELFGLANLEPMPFHAETMRGLATQGVTVLLDVPRAPAAPTTFRAYVEFARKAEQSLGGTLVDDNRKPINQAALDSIAMQLEAIHKTMSARGIVAGSPVALRLFS
ncbi:MAG: cell division protein ZipA C-terminal FtsZ-binding domain-containing protein [Burkholderiales bacterium]|nr:cell division protein ZipA C-terminal FtsZ-binding domain-containing protein [Burkholderiales bacterium]